MTENNKKLAKCKECSDWYCMECSTHYAWKDFCSHECMEENDRKQTVDIADKTLDEMFADIDDSEPNI